MLDLEGRSREAKIGRILVLVGTVVTALGLVSILVVIAGFGLPGLFPELFPSGFPGPLAILLGGFAAVSAIGIAVAVWALRVDDAEKAGKLAVAAGLLPPIQFFQLVGGILLWISPEAFGEPE